MQYNHIKIEAALYTRPLAICLYDRPLDCDEISVHAKMDKFRFFQIPSSPKREEVSMSSEIIVAFITLVSTVLGSFAGGVASSSLTRYRIKELERKVEKHTAVIERIGITEEKIKVVNRRIRDLEENERLFQLHSQQNGGC